MEKVVYSTQMELFFKVSLNKTVYLEMEFQETNFTNIKGNGRMGKCMEME